MWGFPPSLTHSTLLFGYPSALLLPHTHLAHASTTRTRCPSFCCHTLSHTMDRATLHAHRLTADCLALLQEEFERERAMVDAVMRRIEEEEAAAAEAARQRQQDTQADIQRFLAQQQELKKRWGMHAAGPVAERGKRAELGWVV